MSPLDNAMKALWRWVWLVIAAAFAVLLLQNALQAGGGVATFTKLMLVVLLVRKGHQLWRRYWSGNASANAPQLPSRHRFVSRMKKEERRRW